MKTSHVLASVLAPLALALPFNLSIASASPQYGYTIVARSINDSGIFFSFSGAPVVNNSGQVAFIAFKSGTGGSSAGIYVGSGGALTTIIDNTGPIQSFTAFDMNDAGEVAFTGSRDDGSRGTYRFDGAKIVPIAQLTDGLRPSSPRINNNGLVAFSALNASFDPAGIFVGDGNALVNIAAPVGPIASIYSNLSLNDHDQIAFLARMQTGENVIYLGDAAGGPLQDLYTSGPSLFVSEPALNNLGQVAFIGNQGVPVDDILRGDGGTLSNLTNGAFVSLLGPLQGLNDFGEIAVQGQRLAGSGPARGVFVAGTDPLGILFADPSPGTFLGGRLVATGLGSGFNNAGQAALSVQIDYGSYSENFILLATPVPEPSTLKLAIAGLMMAGFLGVVRRRW